MSAEIRGYVHSDRKYRAVNRTGVLARRWHVDTSRLRIGDTLADTIFYACVLIVILLRHPGALQQRWFLLATLIAAEIGQHAFAFARYGRNASYHSILAKCWGS